MKHIKSHFTFSKQQRSGIFVLLLLILSLQSVYFFVDFSTEDIHVNQNDLAMFNAEVDSLKQISIQNNKPKIYPFNPNYITDYKGYSLGMTTIEIDRLLAFRDQNKWINSAKDFQRVTKVSDSLLAQISPYFKFPDWVTAQNNRKRENHKFFEQKKIVKKSINSASKEEIMEVYGIGDKLSDIILRDKEKFGEFATLDQLQYVWGISPETFDKIKERFFVEPSSIGLKKIKINEASTKELSQFPYFNYKIAKEIITYRSMNGGIKSSDELTKIKDFPVEKIEIIILYLEIN
ncbi:MAG: helix-hairpin-helix domain-containing protein [Ignavibacteriae bacterium]|nr:helix-hairpin-helix domain-containing protein [Ignavibacteriota bacterium]